MAEEKKRSGLMLILIAVVLSAGISMIGTFIIVKYLNAPPAQQKVTSQLSRTMAILIRSGSNQTFPLRGGNQVLVVDSLTFLVGSAQCSQEIGIDTPQIMDGIQMLILSKSANEILNPDGFQTLKQQIADLVDQITGYTGDKAPLGVLQVYMYIKAVAST
ncbi:MAG: flagellar basal body protein FliL [Mesoaciditoga sp.]|uniref:flagellar basal body-associated FliL family protein n=1 Tax=Athalassotoga sp. TaxID=2022597 RepID=UPI000CB85583|nr:MAG: flagellar basal body protein FliL [Mesoaciditoga sp.]PMP80428.1 MAG: flagellar basal body protein FliL [Mesoaciditoga sp.]HEU25143.1 flagellar basal body protein FliL [Mesoaciditoga lauensis]